MTVSSFDDESLLPLSGLQHFAYCKRQWALIHIERQWDENVATVDGRHLHQKVHSQLPTEARGDTLIARSLPLVSRRLGLYGVADVVEFVRPVGGEDRDSLAELPGREGKWIVRPVEYKRGRPKSDDRDEVQLCAQAMCLEEMLNIVIKVGYLFYGKVQRRTLVSLTTALRDRVRDLSKGMHQLFDTGFTPRPEKLSRCSLCSLADICLPKTTRGRPKSVEQWMTTMVNEMANDPDGVM